MKTKRKSWKVTKRASSHPQCAQKSPKNCESQFGHRALELTNWTTSIPAIRTPVSSAASNPSWSSNSSGPKGYTAVIPNMATQSRPSCARGHLPVTLRENWWPATIISALLHDRQEFKGPALARSQGGQSRTPGPWPEGASPSWSDPRAW